MSSEKKALEVGGGIAIISGIVGAGVAAVVLGPNIAALVSVNVVCMFVGFFTFTGIFGLSAGGLIYTCSTRIYLSIYQRYRISPSTHSAVVSPSRWHHFGTLQV
jgi:hypothetical protein